MAEIYTNLPRKSEDNLDKTKKQLTEDQYIEEFQFNAGEYDAVIGFFVKRGFGRATDFVSQDVRNGLLTREEGFKIAEKEDQITPKALDYYLKITGYSKKEFLDILKN